MRWRNVRHTSVQQTYCLEYEGSEICALVYAPSKTWAVYGPRKGGDPNRLASGEAESMKEAKRIAREKLKDLMALEAGDATNN